MSLPHAATVRGSEIKDAIGDAIGISDDGGRIRHGSLPDRGTFWFSVIETKASTRFVE